MMLFTHKLNVHMVLFITNADTCPLRCEHVEPQNVAYTPRCPCHSHGYGQERVRRGHFNFGTSNIYEHNTCTHRLLQQIAPLQLQMRNAE